MVNNNIDHEEIMENLDQCFEYEGEVSIDSNGLVSIEGDVFLVRMDKMPIQRLPVMFKQVTGSLMLEDNLLETLEGCPPHVGIHFSCWNNQIRKLDHGPSTVGRRYNCGQNRLTNLVGAPQRVPGGFLCMDNLLETLDGLPEYIGDTLYLNWNQHMPMLRTLAARKIVFYAMPVARGPAEQVLEILNRYAGKGEAGAFECGAELATAGFKENARW